MYITKTDYAAYYGVAIPDAEFDALAARASDIIDMLTMQQIPAQGGLTALPADTQAAVKKATCAQAETLYLNGGIEAAASGGEITGASIGKFSYQAGSGYTIGGMPVAPLASSYLAMTGLLYRGLRYVYP